MSGISDRVTKLKEKVEGKIFWNKNGLSLSELFFCFSSFLTFRHRFPRSVKISLSFS